MTCALPRAYYHYKSSPEGLLGNSQNHEFNARHNPSPLCSSYMEEGGVEEEVVEEEFVRVYYQR